MAELKTKVTGKSPAKFVASIADDQKRKDSQALMKLMGKVTSAQPKMWGPSIVGFGSYHYKYASGREGDWFLVGFSPRATALTVYIMGGITRQKALLRDLGKHKVSTGSCLYVRRLEDIDVKVLEKLIVASVRQLQATRT